MILHAPASIIARLNDGNQLFLLVSIRVLILGHLRCAQISLASVNRSRVDTLFWLAESYKVLDHRGDVEALEALDVAVSHLSRKVWIFAKHFFNLGAVMLVPCIIGRLSA